MKNNEDFNYDFTKQVLKSEIRKKNHSKFLVKILNKLIFMKKFESSLKIAKLLNDLKIIKNNT
jgi:hypothetical protein